jgi:hypothetical protein
VILRPAGADETLNTVISGHYRAGALAQTTYHAGSPAEELIVAADPVDGVTRSYTHAPGEASWTRWPGAGFDAFFGLASPLSALRLYPLADETMRGDPDTLPDAPEATAKIQALISEQTIARLLEAGASAVAVNAEQRSALEFQLAPLLTQQTITYWVAETGRVYQAAATLLITGEDGQPTPWLEAIWRYWGYDDPTISVIPPDQFADVAELAPATSDAAAASEAAPLAPDTTLRVRAFANPGTPVGAATITIYPAQKNQPVASLEAADAQFALPAGVYDVRAQAENAEVWLRNVVVAGDAVASHDVLFDFGGLTLTITQDGAEPQVDIVIYPAGQRQTWIAWRTENPTTLRLPAGTYDVEVARPDYSATKRVEGIEVQPGAMTSVTVDLAQ